MRECLASYLILLWFFLFHQGQTSFQLLGLWADATGAEEKRLARDKLVFRLDASCTIKRGTQNVQTSLWPPMWLKKRKESEPPSIQTLEWKGVATTSRAIILDLGALQLQVSG